MLNTASNASANGRAAPSARTKLSLLGSVEASCSGVDRRPTGRKTGGFAKHRFRAVDADDVTLAHLLEQDGRQPGGAASEIEDAFPWPGSQTLHDSPAPFELRVRDGMVAAGIPIHELLLPARVAGIVCHGTGAHGVRSGTDACAPGTEGTERAEFTTEKRSQRRTNGEEDVVRLGGWGVTPAAAGRGEGSRRAQVAHAPTHCARRAPSSLDRAPRGHARWAASSPFRLRSLRCSVVNSVVFATSCSRPPQLLGSRLTTTGN